jgi:uncharacterized protein (TIGR00369 family)
MDAIKYLQDPDLSADPPEGFRLLPTGGGFNCLFGAVYGCVIEDRLVLGFRVSPRHLNPHNTCHGGVLATFADMMAYAAQWEAGLLYTLTPTISLSTDFLAPALLGQWIRGDTELVKSTRTMLFTQSIIRADETSILRCNAIYKIGASKEDSASVIGNLFGNPAKSENRHPIQPKTASQG